MRRRFKVVGRVRFGKFSEANGSTGSGSLFTTLEVICCSTDIAT